jgi:hypothetical protein
VDVVLLFEYLISPEDGQNGLKHVAINKIKWW